MAVKAFSNEWASAFKDEVNKSSAYKSAAKGWKWTVGLVVEAEPDKHFPEAKGIVMDLFDGEARDVKVGSAAGMLQGKLKLKGDLPTIVRYTKASQEMTECTTRVPVEWPDEK